MFSNVQFILASSSPRRQELLTSLGLDFEIIKPGFEEIPAPDEPAIEYTERNATGKVQWVLKQRSDPSGRGQKNHPHRVIIGADTIVLCDHQILEKPLHEGDAFRMLRLLSGRTHQVITGVCVAHTHPTSLLKLKAFTCTTDVTIKKLEEREIIRYIQTKEPMDKAGAYGIQGQAAYMIKSLKGSYTNVVGLPLAELWEILAGIDHSTAPRCAE